MFYDHVKENAAPLLLAGAMMLNAVPAYAIDTQVVSEEGSASAQISLSIQAPEEANVFSAVIPAIIPANIDLSGNVMTPNNASIINKNTYRGIKATSIRVETDPAWNLADFQIGPSETPDAKFFAISLRGDESDTSGEVTLTPGNWNVPAGGELPIPLELKVSPQTKAGTKSTLANIRFVLDWDGDYTPDHGDESERDYYLLRFDAGADASLKDQETEIQLKKSEFKGHSIRVKFPAVYPNYGKYFDHWEVVKGDAPAEFINDVLHITGDTTLRAVCKDAESGTAYITCYGGDHALVENERGEYVTSYTKAIKFGPDGHIKISTPRVKADPGYVFTGWINTVTKNPAGNVENLGNNTFSLTATTKEDALSGTYRAGHPSVKLIDPDDSSVQTIIRKVYHSDNGHYSYRFPGVQTRGDVKFDKWINTKTGTPAAQQDGGELEVVNDEFDATATVKAALPMYIYPKAGPNGNISSTTPVHLPYGGTVQGAMPAPIPNPGYHFAGWYYDDGTMVEFKDNIYIIDASKGVEFVGDNQLKVNVTARFDVGEGASLMSNASTEFAIYTEPLEDPSVAAELALEQMLSSDIDNSEELIIFAE